MVHELQFVTTGLNSHISEKNDDFFPLHEIFRFPGQYYDQETGLHYNYFRYYNPQTGRYIIPDPIGLEGGINLFAYANSNAINYKDVLGLWRTEGHRNLTLFATKPFSNFFTPADVQRLAGANVGMDITNPFENSAHSMPGTKEKAESIIQNFMKNAIELEQSGAHDAAMYFLGAGLHTLQDRYSHYEQNAGWDEHSIWTLGPDDPAVQINEYTRAALASREYIKGFIEEINKRKGIKCK